MPVKIGYSIADIAAIKALPTVDLITGYARLVTSVRRWFSYNSSSTATADDVTVLLPTSGVGRWLQVSANVTSTDVADFNEAAQDAIGAALVDSSTIDATYNDGANTISFAVVSNSIGDTQVSAISQSKVTGLVTALAGKANTSHTHVATDITDFNEAAQDAVAAALVAGTNISVTYNDTLNTITIGNTNAGEANTATNINTTGVGVFDNKTGVDLRFRGIAPASNKVSVVFNNTDKTIDFDVNQTNLVIAESQVTGLTSALAGKASTSHTHVAANITDFTTATQTVITSSLVAGTNISLSTTAGVTTINSTAGGGGLTGVVTKQNNVTVVAAATTYNFTGSGVTVTAPGGTVADIDIQSSTTLDAISRPSWDALFNISTATQVTWNNMTSALYNAMERPTWTNLKRDV